MMRQRFGQEVCYGSHRLYALAILLGVDDAQRLMTELEAEVFGLGPIEPLMNDPTVSDILVNGAREVYVERRGRLELTDIIVADDQHVLRIIQRIVSRVGRRVDEVSPMVDARLPDGSRVKAEVAPQSRIVGIAISGGNFER